MAWTIEAAKKSKPKSDEYEFLEPFIMGTLVEFITPYKGIKEGTRAKVIDSYPDRGVLRLRMENKGAKAALELSGKDIYKVDIVQRWDLP